MSKISSEEVGEIIETLQGTCDTLTGAVQEVTGKDSLDEYDLEEHQHEQIDNEIFLCTECSWWYEVCDREEDDVCSDCLEASS